MTTPRKGPESILSHPDTSVEAWIFWPEEYVHRCQWPTAELASRLINGDEPDPDGYAARAVLSAYVSLLTYPLGTENSVQRLRALRRAERNRPNAKEAK